MSTIDIQELPDEFGQVGEFIIGSGNGMTLSCRPKYHEIYEWPTLSKS